VRAETHEHLEGLPDALWQLVADAPFFFHRAFLEVMRDSAVEDARYRYVVLFDDGEPVGFAVLTRIVLRLDLLSGDPWIARLRKVVPFVFDVPIVCCGVPASFGQHHLHLAPGAGPADAVRLVHAEMEAWAGEERTGMLVWKEWSPELGIRDHVRAHGYEAMPTLPDHHLVDLPDTVEEWLGRMRRSYRGKYKQARELMEGEGPVWEAGGWRLEATPFAVGHAEPFHASYLRLMDRVESRLETYPLAFFRELAASALDTRRLHLLNTENGEELTGLLIARADFLSFILVAKDRAEYESPVYPLLLRCIALYAIQGGFRTVRLGQTSSYAKCQAGAVPLRRETYLKMTGRLRHKALRRFGDSLFPEAELPDVHVYKEETVAS
jgi:hypothetical protein